MDKDSNASTIVNHYLAIHAAHDFEAMAALIADDLRFTTMMGVLGKPEYLAFWRALASALPDVSMQTPQVAVAGNDVTVLFSLAGTHTKTFDLKGPGMKPLPATGRKVSVDPARIHFVVGNEGRITEIFPEAGHAGGIVNLLRQMGADIPAPGVAQAHG